MNRFPLEQPTLPANTYTDAPRLVRNPLLSFFQLFFWLFSHPSAWENQLHRIDASLTPDFCLAGLTLAQWKKPVLLRLLLKAYLPVFILPPLLVLIIRAALGHSAQALLGGVLTSLAFAVGAGLAAGAMISVPSGLVLGFGTGLGAGLAAFYPEWYVLPIAIACGLTGAAQMNHAAEGRNPTASRVVFVGLLGLAISGLVVWGTTLLAATFANSPVTEPATVFPRLAIYLLGGWLLSAAVLYHVFHLRAGRSRRGAAGLAGLVGLPLTLLYLALLGVPISNPWASLWFSLAGALFLSMIYALVYTLVGWLGSGIAAAIAGALGAAFSFMPLMPFFSPVHEPLPGLLLYAAIGFGLAFTINFWSPLLFYPITVVYHGILLMLDRQETHGPLKYFPYHAMFWSESQRLGWYKLDQHLILLAERQPEMADIVFSLAVQRGQAAAVRRAQIELAARQMEQCRSLEEIGTIHRRLPAGELAGPASGIIHQFVELSQNVLSALPPSSGHYAQAQLSAALNRLKRIQKELIVNGQHEAQRFAPIAGHWQHILDQGLQQMDISDLLPNPYVCGSPLSASETVFVGRLEVMQRIEQTLMSPHGGSILLYGQRRMGKTSLLLNLERILPSRILYSFVDCQACASAANYYEVTYCIAQQIKRSVERQGHFPVPALDYNLWLYRQNQAVVEWYDALVAMLEENNLYLLVNMDEIEALNPLFSQPDQAATFLSRLRHAIQHRKRYKIVLASSHTLDEIQHWSEYLVNLQLIKIGYLNEAEARQLIESPVPGFPLRYAPQAVEQVLALTRGQPNLVQALCYELVHLKNTQPASARFVAIADDVELAAAQTLETGGFFFADYLRQVPPGALPMLRYLAGLGAGAAISAEAWRAAFAADFEQNVNILLRRDLVELTPAGYGFQIELVRRWFCL